MKSEPIARITGRMSRYGNGIRVAVCLLGLMLGGSPLLSVAAPNVSNRVIQVSVPGAMCAAVQDDMGRLVVGVRETNAVRLVMYGLDSRGNVLPTATPGIVIPKSDVLKDYAAYPLDVMWHPRLPLLYVWQDIMGPAVSPVAQNPVFREFDHLVVYTVVDGGLHFVQSYARGRNYAWKQSTGRIALDPLGKRLFMPNMLNLAGDRAQIGYLVLHTNGLPVVVDDKVTPSILDIMDVRSNPSGSGFLAANDRTLIFSSALGPATWDTDNRRAACNLVAIRNLPVFCYLGGNPNWPAIFGAAVLGSMVYRVEHADGYLSLLPQTVVVPKASFTAPPVIMLGKPEQVAIGGVNKIHFLSFNSTGRMAENGEDIPVNCHAVQAMAYSVKYDRLYVAVEKLP